MNVIGFDDGPFPRTHRGDVLLVGAVCAGVRLDGVVSGKIRRDGADATRKMAALVEQSQFKGHLQAVLLQGIAVGGFNVVDVRGLSEALRVPVVVVMRRAPNLSSIRRALFSDDPPGRPRVAGAKRKWRLIQRAGQAEELSVRSTTPPTGLRDRPQSLWVQRVGLSLDDARRLVESTTLHGHVPEPLRLAHLIAGGIGSGRSRGRA